MRIISGEAGGRNIRAPKGKDTRPTLDRVKEALFGIIQLQTPDAVVLDLYAGSGNLGLEALSRGAKRAVFNDSDRACCAVIRENIEALGFSSRATVLNLEALSALDKLKGSEAFDIIFLDPPYRDGAEAALERIFANGLLLGGGTVIVEHDYCEPPLNIPGSARCVSRRKYGGVGLSFFVGGYVCT